MITEEEIIIGGSEGRQRSFAPFVALVWAQIFFGSLPVIGKYVLAELPPMGLVGIRVAITTAILVLVQLYRRRFWLKQKGDYWRFALLSLFGVVFNQIFFITGLSMTKASNTSLLAVIIPVCALTVGSIAGFEKLTGKKIVGIILAAAGVILLLDPRNASFSSETTIGDILIILNSISYGIYVATSKDVIIRNGTFRSIMWVFIFACIICLPVGGYSLAHVNTAAVSGSVWAVAVYIAIGATAAPYLLNAWALSKVNPSTVAVFVYLQPVIGFLLAVVFLGENIDLRFIASAAMIFIGVFLVTRRFIPAET